MLDRDALLSFAAVTVEGFGQSREHSREFGRLFQVLMPTIESLLPKRRGLARRLRPTCGNRAGHRCCRRTARPA